MMTQEEIDKMLATMEERGRSLMIETGNHPPIMLLFTDKPDKEGGATIVHLGPIIEMAEEAFARGDSDTGYKVKQAMAYAMHAAVEEVKPFGLITIMDAYISKPKGDSLLGLDQQPRSDPNRIEAMTMYWEFKMANGSKLSMSQAFPYKRVGRKVTFDEKREKPFAMAEGPMTNFLK